MKVPAVTIILFFTLSLNLFGNDTFKDEYYQSAYNELISMLNGEKQLDFKRAVFISENAYLENTLDYNHYCKRIDSIVFKMKWLIKAKRIEKFKTAPFYAAYSYMCEPSIINDSTICKYDFDDFMGYENWQNMFVTKLMSTKKGNCHSLPFFYKILTEEIGVEAHLAIAPSHVYIKHLDENDKWVNIELTNGGGFSSDAWIISSMGITAEAIKNEIFMAPLSRRESVALCLYDLAMGYKEKYGFEPAVKMMLDSVLGYYPNCIIALLLKADYVSSMAIEYLKDNNGSDSVFIDGLKEEYNEINSRISNLGYTDMPEDLYEAWAKSIELEAQKEKNDSSTINQENPR